MNGLWLMSTEAGEQRFQCPSCGRSYKYKHGLTEHLRYECGKDPQFLCPHCPYKARKKNSLKSHIAFKHFTAIKTKFNLWFHPYLLVTKCSATNNVYYKNYVVIYAIESTNLYILLNTLF